MKRITLLSAALALCSSVFAQQYLQDTYIEVGISDCGTHITDNAPPASFATETAGLGIVADPEQDGFTTGTITDYCGDYVMPGSPQEGFAVEYDGTISINDGQCAAGGFMAPDLLGTNVRQVATGTFSGNLWKGGDAGGMQVRQFTLVGSGSRSIIHQVVITNGTGSDVSNLYYMRSTDPDNGQPWTGNFTTENAVESASFGTGAAATARSTSGGSNPDPKCQLLLLSADDRASASYGNFFIATPSDAVVGAGGYLTSGSAIADQAIQLTFDLGSLDNGESTCLSLAYVTDREEGIAAWKATKRACNPAIDDFLVDGDDTKLAESLFGSATADLKSKITAYPNPSTNSFNVDLRSLDPETCTINVFNTMGSLVLSRQASSSTEPVQHNLIPGLYVVQVESNGKSYTTQISVQ